VQVVTLLSGAELRAALAADVRAGLTRSPKAVRSRWLWDEHGSELFEAITGLPEYYLTRTEQEILERFAPEIARLAGAEALVELGPGSSVKTTVLLDALVAGGALRRYTALDVSEAALGPALRRLAERYPSLEVTGLVADFERHLGSIHADGRVLVAFLGSTLGALDASERAALLGELGATLAPEDGLLLGVDLVKPVERIVAAYTDPDGLSAKLIANLLLVLNRELGARFDPALFVSEAVWNPELERMEMAVRSLTDQVVPILELGLDVEFRRGETLRTEISTKFRREGLQVELAAAGLELAAWWTDDAGDYAVCLARAIYPSSEGLNNPK
jgi:L-histidine N-alpha-methyltransferase